MIKYTFKKLVLFACTFPLLCGCITTYSAVQSDVTTPYTSTKEAVYVTNTDHANYPVLKRSKIYNLADSKDAGYELTLLDSIDVA